MLAEEVIIRPVVTEKSNDELQQGKYTFEVNKKATKVDIAKAVEKLFEGSAFGFPLTILEQTVVAIQRRNERRSVQGMETALGT